MRWIVGTVMLVLLPGVAAAFVTAMVAFSHAPSLLVPIGAGAVLGILLDHVILRKFPVVETFEHEFTHAIVALLFFRRITGFTVRRSGGTVAHRGRFGGVFGSDCIGLAPYIFPTFTVFSVLARPLIPPGGFPWYDGWIGATFGYHLWSMLEETRAAWTKRAFPAADGSERTQSDIGRRGYIYSGIFIATGSLLVHGLLVAVLLGGMPGVAAWGRESWNVTVLMVGRAGAGLFVFARRLYSAVAA
jgi:hypothetical protein